MGTKTMEKIFNDNKKKVKTGLIVKGTIIKGKIVFLK